MVQPAPTPPPYLAALASERPASEAPPAVAAEFGRLVGVWRCTSDQRTPDGAWQPAPGSSRWSFFYTLGGRALADVFESGIGTVGVNLRVYDPEAGAWNVAWATASQTEIDRFVARAHGDDIVMRGELPDRSRYPAHSARISFTQITGDAFEWTYEATKPGADGPFAAYSRLHCRREADSEMSSKTG